MQANGMLRLFSLAILLSVLGWGLSVEVGSLAQSVDEQEMQSIAASLDENNNKFLDDVEILEAVRLWVTGTIVSGTGLVIDDDLIRALIRLWVTGGTITGVASGGEGPSIPKEYKTTDDRFAEVAQQVPEFGGMYLGEDGALRVVLLDTSPSVLAAAEAAIAAVYGPDRIPQQGVQAVVGQYGFLQLRGWHELHRFASLEISGVLSTGIDESSNRLKIRVTDQANMAQLEQALSRLGVPREAVDIIESEPIVVGSSHTLTDRQRPIVGGVQLGLPKGTCTLGFVVVRKGEAGFVTNSHCMNKQGGGLGTVVYQNDTSSEANRIGVEAVDPEYSVGLVPLLGSCPFQRKCRFSDAAFIRRDMGDDPDAVPVDANFGFLALPSDSYGGGMTIDHMSHIVREEYSAMEGESLTKVGRTTGATTGKITDTCDDVNPQNNVGGQLVDSGITLLCQHIMAASFASGDSGAPVYDWSSATLPQGASPTNGVYGMAWGGTLSATYFSPIGAMQMELGFFQTYEDQPGENSPPQIKIVSHRDGAEVGFGGLNIETYEVMVFDYEDGIFHCCPVSWEANPDGPLGNGKEFTHTFQTAGDRTITATATDSDGATASYSITLSVGNTRPSVTIVEPQFSNNTVFKGIAINLEGTSFDPNEPFQLLPCEQLVWTSNRPEDPFPVTGCTPQVTFNTTGQRTILLTGTDSTGLMATDAVGFNVLDLLPNTSPLVRIDQPKNGVGLEPNDPFTLLGEATDPNGNALSYEWVLEGTALAGGAGQIVLGTGNTNSGATISLSWTPADNVLFKCGGNPVTIRLRATTSGGKSSADSVNVTVKYGLC